MKLFTVDFPGGSSEKGVSVVVAENVEDVLHMLNDPDFVMSDWTTYKLGERLEDVREDYAEDMNHSTVTVFVQEVDLNTPGVVYTGYCCC